MWVTRTPTGLLVTKGLKLVSSFLEWAGVAPRGHLAMSRDILIVITGGRVLLASGGKKTAPKFTTLKRVVPKNPQPCFNTKGRELGPLVF